MSPKIQSRPQKDNGVTLESLSKRLDVITFWLIGATLLLIFVSASSFVLSINQIARMGLFFSYIKILIIMLVAIIFIAFMAVYGRIRTRKS